MALWDHSVVLVFSAILAMLGPVFSVHPLAEDRFDGARVAAAVRERGARWESGAYDAFDGLTHSELKAYYLGVLEDAEQVRQGRRDSPTIDPPATSFDWTDTPQAYCIGKPVNQLKCGSCWAVSATTSQAIDAVFA